MSLSKSNNCVNGLIFIHVIFVIIFSSCKLPFAEASDRDTEKNSLFLRFNPKPGTAYRYTIENKTDLELEVQGKETEKSTEFDVGITYRISQDSAGSYLFETSYDKVRLVNTDDGVEIVSDAGNANNYSSLTEKMLGALKESKLVVSIAPGNDVKIVRGYEELSRRLMVGLDTTNPYTKQTAQQTIDEVIKKNLVQKNVDQLFRFFPDSAMRIGSKWKVNTKEQQGFTLNVGTFYMLNDINDGVAFISSRGTLKSDNTPIALMGYSAVPDLTGEQEGVYEVEAATCMLLNATVTSSIKGSINLGVSSVPINIKVKVNLQGKRL